MSTRTAIVCLLALCCAAPAAAQAPVATELLSSAGPLTTQQQAEVAAYTDGLARQFESASAQDTLAIRNGLQSLLKDPSARVAFRRELGVAFIKSFEQFVGGADGTRAVNTFVMARMIATAETVDFLLDHMDPDKVPSTATRIAASSQLAKAIEASPLSAPQVDALGKRLVPVMSRETEWVVASHGVEALGSMINRPGLSVAQAEALASSMASVINTMTDAVASGKRPELSNALQRALLVVRNQLSGVAAQARAKLLDSIAPSLKRLADFKDSVPEPIKAAGCGETFGAIVRTAGLLQKVRSTGGA